MGSPYSKEDLRDWRERVTVAFLSGWGPLCNPCCARAIEKGSKGRLDIKKLKPGQKLCVSCSRSFKAKAKPSP